MTSNIKSTKKVNYYFTIIKYCLVNNKKKVYLKCSNLEIKIHFSVIMKL